MQALALRAQGDGALFAELSADRLVQRVNDRLRERERETPLGTRRKLLSGALRLRPRMAPALHDLIERCRARLGIEIPLETYVYPSAQFNAACVKPEAGRLFVLLSSSLLEAFGGRELEFVIGHELGHHLFAHHDVPIGAILEGDERPSPELVLKLFSWSRYAEISADRTGAHCAGDLGAVANALFRLASGLRTDVVTASIDDLSGQVDEYAAELGDPTHRTVEGDWFSTHPFSPLRVAALEAFGASELFVPGGTSVAELEARVATLMALMEPSYLDEKSEAAELMRRTLFAGAIAVADADGTISEAEIAVFEKFFGQRSFDPGLDLAALERDLPQRLADVRERVAPPRRVQLVRDLCLVVRAGGSVDPKRRQVLLEICRSLEVPEALVDQTLESSLEPD
jgi:Zn-dependent protease with chaperone function/uncharacterized tellurite resistance protein B-like protein